MATQLDFLLYVGALGLVVLGLRVAGSSSRRQTRKSLACRICDAKQKRKAPAGDERKSEERPPV